VVNWSAVAAIGQAVSALALIFAFLQVRDTHEEIMKSSLNPDAVRYVDAVLAREGAAVGGSGQ
jgi:hypothetical protein